MNIISIINYICLYTQSQTKFSFLWRKGPRKAVFTPQSWEVSVAEGHKWGLEGRQGQTSGKGKDVGLYPPWSNGQSLRRSKRRTHMIVKRSLWSQWREQIVGLVGKELKQSPASHG